MTHFFYFSRRGQSPGFLLLVICCFFTTILSVQDVHAQLSGSYTIGGTNSDFPSFSQAVEALETSGISDPVIFKVQPGIYNEQFSIDEFAGNSCENPVIFEGDAADSSQVILTFNPEAPVTARNYLVQINGADGISFRNMTLTDQEGGNAFFRSLIRIKNDADCFTLEGNTLKLLNQTDPLGNNAPAIDAPQDEAGPFPGEGLAQAVLYSSAMEQGRSNDGHQYLHNHFIGGGRSIFKVGNNSVRYGEVFDTGTVVAGNRVEPSSGGTGIFLNRQVSPVVRENVVSVPSGEGTGIVISTSKGNQTLVEGNEITVADDGAGIQISNEGSFEVLNNKLLIGVNGMRGTEFDGSLPIIAQGGGIQLFGGSAAVDEPSLVANNLINIMGGYFNTGLSLASNAKNLHIYHNTVTGVNTTGIEVQGGNGHEIINNIFHNRGENNYSYAIHIRNPEGIEVSDYNAFYSAGPYLGQWGSQSDRVATLEEWQDLSGQDEHSIVADPEFVAPDNLIPQNPALSNAGIRLLPVPFDYFGNERDDSPSIGAIEFGEEDPSAPEPTNGLVNGGGWFNSPKGAISNDPLMEGRAVFAFAAIKREGDDRPRGHVMLSIPQAQFRFHSQNSIEWISIDENTAILKGTGQVKREEGYSFVLSVMDNGSGFRGEQDTFRMIIWDSNGEVVYDNQRNAEMYVQPGMAIGGGSINIHDQMENFPAVLNKEKIASALESIKVYPTSLRSGQLWIDFPAMEGLEEVELSILDMQGRKVAGRKLKLTETGGKEQWSLNTLHWPQGIYRLSIEGGGQRTQQKLIK